MKLNKESQSSYNLRPSLHSHSNHPYFYPISILLEPQTTTAILD